MNDLSHTCIDLRIGHICQYYSMTPEENHIHFYCHKHGQKIQKGMQMINSWAHRNVHLAMGGGCPPKDNPDSVVELNL